MAKIVFTTCGTSLLTSACWKEKDIPGLKRLGSINREQAESHNQRKLADFLDSKGWSVDALVQVFDDTVLQNLDGRLGDLPAELSSLIALDSVKDQSWSELGKGDKIILLHSTDTSTTHKGKFCVSVIRKILLEKEIFPGVEVEMMPINGLDPSDIACFEQCLKNMWRSCYSIIKDIKEKEHHYFTFNLTGGYKAMAFTLGALCHEFGLRKYNIRIAYLHDTGKKIFTMSFPIGESGPEVKGTPVVHNLNIVPRG